MAPEPCTARIYCFSIVYVKANFTSHLTSQVNVTDLQESFWFDHSSTLFTWPISKN